MVRPRWLHPACSSYLKVAVDFRQTQQSRPCNIRCRGHRGHSLQTLLHAGTRASPRCPNLSANVHWMSTGVRSGHSAVRPYLTRTPMKSGSARLDIREESWPRTYRWCEAQPVMTDAADDDRLPYADYAFERGAAHRAYGARHMAPKRLAEP